MSLTEWSIRLGLYSKQQVEDGGWFRMDIGTPRNNADFDPQEVWKSITHPRAPAYKPTQSRGIHISDPVLHLAQVFLGYNMFGQANTSSTITQAELYFMWCMKEQRKVHLGYWIATACHTIATHSVRHLNICHLLGAFVKNNVTFTLDDGVPSPKMCPQPKLYDINFFVKVRIVKPRKGELHFYAVGQPDLPAGTMTIARRKNESDEKETPPATREPMDTWKKRVEGMLRTLTETSIARKVLMEVQIAQLTKAISTMEKMCSLLKENLLPQQRQKEMVVYQRTQEPEPLKQPAPRSSEPRPV